MIMGMLRTTLLRNFIHAKTYFASGKKMSCTFESLFWRYYLILQLKKAQNTGAGFHCLSLSKGFNGKWIRLLIHTVTITIAVHRKDSFNTLRYKGKQNILIMKNMKINISAQNFGWNKNPFVMIL